MRNRQLFGGYALIQQPGLAYSLLTATVPASALGVTGLRPVAGAGNHEHLGFVAEAVKPG